MVSHFFAERAVMTETVPNGVVDTTLFFVD